MKRLEIEQMEVVNGGDWRSWAGILCAGGIGAIAGGSALITAGASIPAIAAFGAMGVSACVAGVMGSIYM
jgi:hypothetical protein